MRLEGAFDLQQPALDGGIRCVPPDVSPGPDHAMARDQDRDAVRPHDLAHRPRGAGMADFPCNLAVAAHLAARDRCYRLEHGSLERREPTQVEADRPIVLNPALNCGKQLTGRLGIANGDAAKGV